MKLMYKRIYWFLKTKHGQGFVEYALIVLLVAILIISVLAQFQDSLSIYINKIGTAIDNAPP